jgi:hypothetical protein
MTLNLRIAAFFVCTLLAAPAQALDLVQIPAYNPPIGAEMAYRVTATGSGEFGRNSFGDTPGGSFVNRMTVLEKHRGGFRTFWRVSAEGPDNDLYRETLRVYGVDAITLDTDLAGAAMALQEAAVINNNLHRAISERLRDAPPQKGSVLEKFLKEDYSQPMLFAQAIAPASALLPQQQSAAMQEVEIGAVETQTGSIAAAGATVPVITQWAAQTADKTARTVTIIWSMTADEGELTRAYKTRIDANLADAVAKQGPMPPERAADFAKAGMTRRSVTILSLDTGMALSVEDTIELRIGPMFTRTVTRVARE